MKNLKNLCKIVPILLLITFSGCKENDKAPLDDVVAGELLDYYVVAENNISAHKLSLLYFTQDGNTIKAHTHIQGGYQVRDLVVKNRKFTIDLYADGKSLYNFQLEKDAAGKLKLKSYEFKFNGQDNELAYALLIKKTDLPEFTNTFYKMIRSNVSFSMIKDGVPLGINTTNILLTNTGASIPTYRLANVGFKSNNDEYLGIAVPYWNGVTTPIVLIEIKGLLFIAAKSL